MFFLRWLLFFFLIFFGQAALLSKVTLIDAPLWEDRLFHLQQDLFIDRHISLYDAAGGPRYSGHPGMSFTFLGSIFAQLGFSPATSLVYAISLLNAASIAASLMLIRHLLPRKNLWWLAIMSTFLFNPLVLFVTPTNAVVAPLLVLLFLLTGFLVTLVRPQASPWLILWGIIAGLCLVTRWDTSILTVPFFFLLLGLKYGKRAWLALFVTALISVLFNPLLLFSPGLHLRQVLDLVSRHVTHVYPTPLTPSHIFNFAPLSIISLLLAIYLLIKKDSKLPFFSCSFYLVSLLATLSLVIIVLSSTSRSIRHLFPYILFWEILLPAIEGTNRFSANFLPVLIAIFYIVSFIISYEQIYLLPTRLVI